jgi:methyl-accepting chemotaxis protein
MDELRAEVDAMIEQLANQLLRVIGTIDELQTEVQRLDEGTERVARQVLRTLEIISSMNASWAASANRMFALHQQTNKAIRENTEQIKWLTDTVEKLQAK